MLNLDKLPPALARAVQIDSYDGGAGTDISATTLKDSPRVRRLQRQHHAEIEDDAVRRVMATFGTVYHKLVEEAAPSDWEVEKRLYAPSKDGYIISGAIDVLEPVALNTWNIRDHKVLTSWKAQKIAAGEEKDFERQLNIYSWLLHKNGQRTNKLFVDALVRDWTESMVERYEHYPDTPGIAYEIPLWSLEEQDEYVERMVTLHFGEEMPLCSDEDRWMKPAKWALRKDGKRNRRVLDTEEEAKAALSKFKDAKDYEIVAIPGEPIRCVKNYCGVAEWCHQYKEEQGIV